MVRLLATVCLLVAPTAVCASDAIVTVAEADVRSGPSDKYYATGTLRRGERVEVVGEKNGYLMIAPPSGSFSLIRKSHVERKASGIDVVTQDGAETMVGSPLTNRMDVRGTTLSRGSLVTVLEEVDGYYRILPMSEVRYVAADAVRKAEAGIAGGPPPIPDSPEAPAAWSPSDSRPLTTVEQAEKAYQQRDWSSAQRLFEQLARSNDFEMRTFAQNRLEYIRSLRQASLPSVKLYDPSEPIAKQPAAQAEPKKEPPANHYPKPSSAYTYRVDGVPAKLSPTPVEPIPLKPVPAKPVSLPKPPPPLDPPKEPNPPKVEKKEAVTLQPVAKGDFSVPGRLRKAFVTDAGRPLYFLEYSAGKLRCYLSPAEGLDLAGHLNKLVEVHGMNKSYRSELHGDHFIAVRVEPLTN